MGDDSSDSHSEGDCFVEANELPVLKRQRAAYKGQFTSFRKYVTTQQGIANFTADQIIELQLRIDNITRVYKKFNKVQESIETISSDVEVQMGERDGFEDLYFKTIAQAKAMLQNNTPKSNSQEPVQDLNKSCTLEIGDQFVKYPEISLPMFKGDFRDWLEFRETFDALINQSALKPIQKFKYLRSCLVAGALEVISSIEYTSDNYNIAWKLLCERYNNPRLLVSNHLRALCDIEPIQETPHALRSVVDNISKHLRSLRSLKLNTEDWDPIMIHLVSTKLPPNLQNKWEERSTSKELPSLQEFKNFIRTRADQMDTVQTRISTGRDAQAKKAMVTTSSEFKTNISTCPMCKGKHFLYQCPRFLALQPVERIRMVKKFRICFNCFNPNHLVPNCRSMNCKHCNGKHHSLLHLSRAHQTSIPTHPQLHQQPTTLLNSHSNETIGTSRFPQLQSQAQANNNINNNSAAPQSNYRQRASTSSQEPSFSPRTSQLLVQNNYKQVVFLSTALVYVIDNLNNKHILRVLLDSGSQSNFITQRAFNLLNIEKQRTNMQVIGFNNNSSNIDYLCKIKLQSRNQPYSTELSCLIVPNICNITKQRIDITPLNIPQHLVLADEKFYEASEIDILIGVELFYRLLCKGQQRLGEGLPILQKTQLGWIVSGAMDSAVAVKQEVRCNLSLNSQLRKFWEIEECSISEKVRGGSELELSHDEIQCEEVFKCHTRSSDGNFVVNLPLKASPKLLGESRSIAFQRFKSLERRFARDEQYKQLYVNFMKDFEQAGRMIECDIKPETPPNYLAHHGVLNPEKPSTPLRVVFNASQPTSTGVSLNDIQHKGTIRQDKLINLLLRFRLHTYVINADIEKMFCNILLSPEQRYLQCILWREEPHHPLKTYTLTTLSFGLKAAPHIATRCLLQLSQETHALLQTQSTATSSTEATGSTAGAANAIASEFYADDLLTGGDDLQEVAAVALEADRILKSAGFKLRKWKSNSALLQGMLIKNTNSPQTHITDTQFGDDTHKILGLSWSGQSDHLLYCIKIDPIPKKVTKRIILSKLSSIFDPTGLISPVLITAKCLIQRLWQDKTGWDDPVPEHLQRDWITFYEKLKYLTTLKIPRLIVIANYVVIELHGFSDASNRAMGAACYVRSIDIQGNTLVRLLYAKSKVAPLKKQTTPKLELIAAHLLANTMQTVKESLKCEVNKVQFWSDSSVVLAWIKTQPHKLNRFVSNRVSHIQALSRPADWSWVSSYYNPADILSRGIDADKIKSNSQWWHGPPWLSRPEQEWPQQEVSLTCPLPELKQTSTCNITTNNNNIFFNDLFTRFSSDSKLFRVFAYVQRFIYNCKEKANKIKGPISLQELEEAKNSLYQVAQRESFPCEISLLKNNKVLPNNSVLLSLKPFIKDNLLRVGGRISLSSYHYNKKHPVILHAGHTLTKLIMTNEHIRLFHAGPQLLLAAVRERIWPVQGKKLATKIVSQCVTCFKAKPETTIPIMGNLPSTRVNPAPPFHITGIDYTGHFTLRDRRGRGYKTYKCYVAIFVCFATKAIHIELITGLSTEAFLGTLRRFISRRGRPRELISDNSTTFRGANNELGELFNFFNVYFNDVDSFCVDQGIKWNFIPVYSPHMGSLWESAVRICKFHLKRVLGQSLLTYEEFVTVLVQVEGIVNSRPLCPIPYSDSEVIQTLTPAHFLIGRPIVALPDYDYEDVPTNNIKYFQQLQQICQGFWRKWSREYIGLLQQRTKWRSSKGANLTVGAVVLLKDERLPACQWPLARILRLHPGQDGVARVATMKTAKGTVVRRSFANICPLPNHVYN